MNLFEKELLASIKHECCDLRVYSRKTKVANMAQPTDDRKFMRTAEVWCACVCVFVLSDTTFRFLLSVSGVLTETSYARNLIM